MSEKIENILNDCLERMAKGEELQHCIERYPEHKDELVPMLRIAEITMQSAKDISYNEEVRARCMARFNVALVTRNKSSKWLFLSFFSQPLARPLIASMMAVFVVIVAAGGSTIAAEDTVPGDTLYWVKTTRENVTLVMPRSDMEKAEVHAQLATRRGEEIQRLIALGRFIEAELMMNKFKHHLNQSATNAGFVLPANPIEMPIRHLELEQMQNAQALKHRLEQDGMYLRNRMATLVQDAPQPQQRRVRRIYHQSDLGYRILIQALDNGNGTGQVSFVRISQPFFAVPAR